MWLNCKKTLLNSFCCGFSAIQFNEISAKSDSKA